MLKYIYSLIAAGVLYSKGPHRQRHVSASGSPALPALCLSGHQPGTIERVLRST